MKLWAKPKVSKCCAKSTKHEFPFPVHPRAEERIQSVKASVSKVPVLLCSTLHIMIVFRVHCTRGAVFQT